MEDKQYKYTGQVRTKRRVAAKDSHPPSVEALAQGIHDGFWYRRTVSEGIQDPIEYECIKRQVTLCRDGLPDRFVWLMIKRSIGTQPSYWYYLSNAPLNSRLPLFVWLNGIRWAIEQCFEEVKTDLGMDHYQGCSMLL